MKKNVTSLLISGIFCFGCINLAYADNYQSSLGVNSSSSGYSSSTTPPAEPESSANKTNSYYSSGESKQPDSGYYSSGSSNKSNSGYYSSGSHKKRRYSVSVDGPLLSGRVVFNNNYAQGHSHRKLGPQWINSRQGVSIPPDAVIGGGEGGSILYICRGDFRGGIHPGKLTPIGTCIISWGGNEVVLTRYQILVSHLRLPWVNGSYGYVPVNAIPGGYEAGSPRFICQADYRGGRYPGKIVGQQCNIAWGGREIVVPFYKVLVR